jgi:uncharacterized damage-inducible protein DinB
MAEILEALIRQLEATHDGDPWYGSSREKLLAGITAAQANAKPVAGGHSIWEQVLHMTSWTREVTRRAGGAEPRLPVEGNWPVPQTPAEPEWKDAREALARAHRELIAVLRALPSARWTQPVGPTREAGLGTGLSVLEMVIGLAQHEAYHIGQIAMLRRAVQGTRTEGGSAGAFVPPG